MKLSKTNVCRVLFCAVAAFVITLAIPANAQPPGVKTFNPFRATFTRRWTEKLTERVKLIDFLPDAKRGGLAFVAETAERDALKRRLILTHWDGFKFTTDGGADFISAPPDALLVGKFRESAAPPTAAVSALPAPPKQKKKSAPPPQKSQIVTSEGVYEWDGKTLNRLYAAPPGAKFALEIENRSERFATGSGDQTAQYALTDDGFKVLLNFDAPLAAAGFARSGIGAQDIPNAASSNLPSGARYVQSYWLNRNRWLIGLLQTTNGTGDTLVVYAPKFTGKDKSFWASTFDDFEEIWRSGLLPGHVLDVRVGDPKNEGYTGFLVLTAENNDQDRTLSFFAPVLGAK